MVPSTLNPMQPPHAGNRIAETAKGQTWTLEIFGSADRRDFASRSGRLGGAPRVPYRTRLDSSAKVPLVTQDGSSLRESGHYSRHED